MLYYIYFVCRAIDNWMPVATHGHKPSNTSKVHTRHARVFSKFTEHLWYLYLCILLCQVMVVSLGWKTLGAIQNGSLILLNWIAFRIMCFLLKLINHQPLFLKLSHDSSVPLQCRRDGDMVSFCTCCYRSFPNHRRRQTIRRSIDDSSISLPSCGWSTHPAATGASHALLDREWRAPQARMLCSEEEGRCRWWAADAIASASSRGCGHIHLPLHHIAWKRPMLPPSAQQFNQTIMQTTSA
jgi:hypothetical protein